MRIEDCNILTSLKAKREGQTHPRADNYKRGVESSTIVRNSGPQRRLVVLFQGIVFLALGLYVTCLGYESSATFLSQELIGPIFFWYAVILLAFSIPLRAQVSACLQSLHTKLGSTIFVVYLAIHLVVYGFLLELLLSAIYGIAFILSPNLTIVTETFRPFTAQSVFYDITFNPSIYFDLPPVLSGSVSTYAVTVAVLIDVLILANISKAIELDKLTRSLAKARSYFVIPLVGLILGASCCVSVPALISYVYPAILTSSSFDWIYDTTYFFFPVFALLILYLNFYSMCKISDGLKAQHSTSTVPQGGHVACAECPVLL